MMREVACLCTICEQPLYEDEAKASRYESGCGYESLALAHVDCAKQENRQCGYLRWEYDNMLESHATDLALAALYEQVLEWRSARKMFYVN